MSFDIICLGLTALAIPFCLQRFFVRNQITAVLNPNFYFVGLCYFYLIWGSLYAPIELGVKHTYAPAVIQHVNYLCCYVIWSFTLLLYCSKRYQLQVIPKFHPAQPTIIIASILILLIETITFYLLWAHHNQLLEIIHDRGLALIYFQQNINEPYRYFTLAILLQVSVTILVLKTRRLRYLAILLPIILLEGLSNGRMITLGCFIVMFLNYYLLKRKIPVITVCIGLVVLIAAGVIRTFVHTGAIGTLGYIGEFTMSRYMDNIIFAEYLDAGSLWGYIRSSFAIVIPSFVRTMLHINLLPLYGSEINDMTNDTAWLAGNIVGEMLYYGGMWLTLLIPWLLGGFFLLIQRIGIVRYFVGLIFMMFLITQMFYMIRIEVLPALVNSIYLFVVYLCWVYGFEMNKRIFYVKCDPIVYPDNGGANKGGTLP